jgi:serine/threonine-protein kinase RsbW
MSQTDVNLEIVVPTQTRYLSLIGNIAEVLARAIDQYAGDRDTLAYHLNLVLTEALVNVIKHATPADAKDTVRVNISIEGDNLCIRVFDHGQGFDLECVPAPDFDNLSEEGRGVFLIRTLMDSVAYHRSATGNVLEMHMKLAAASR